jgi:transketolase
MEGKAKYHGSTLSMDMAGEALKELGLDDPLAQYKERRISLRMFKEGFTPPLACTEIIEGEPRTYPVDAKSDNRSAYGAALEDLARLNNGGPVPRIVGFSCDLEDSVKMGGFHKVSANAFFETGIQEHHGATLAGAISKEGFAAFFSTFGVFGVCETYNQHRLNDMNGTNLKLVCTHLGLDVGEDGQTHQCIDYLGLLQNLFNFSVFMPADPNQTDRIIRHVAARRGNFFVGMGRSKAPVVTDEAGEPFFAGTYRFEPGKADWLRRGTRGAIFSYGVTTLFAMEARKALAEEHGLDLAVVNFASIKPLDVEAVLEAAKTGLILTVEDHHVDTGLGARVATVLADSGTPARLVRLGVRRYGHSGSAAALFRSECIDKESIVKTVLEALGDGRSKEK